ncbi:ABC transporter permease [Fodinicola acaciae]|uniref:ABC transporter permease n=1 Tax=Fodinicola acaciae TaxID=2681555 RepID=UPI0013D0E35E|nr:polyketide antibiotic transporter [Fodinicola acaciae]
MTFRLIRLALRRERVFAPWWLLLLVVGALTMIAYIKRNMPTAELMHAYVTMINHNAFFRALGGDYVIPDLGYMAAWRSGGFLYVSIALASIMTVIRHTRADEDAGRIEILRVSRRAPLTAALSMAGGISLLGGILVSLVVFDPPGSIAYGAAIVAAGWVFAAIAAVAAQLAQNARTARVIALAVLGVAYVLRYAGDASGLYWMKYISPIGWSHLVSPYNANRWWVLLVPVLVTAALTVLAYALADRRDLGAGVIPQRPGPASAPGLHGALALAWRLHRALLAKWAIGVGVFAVAAGGMSTLAYQLANAPSRSVDLLLKNFTGTSGATVIDGALWSLVLIFAYVIALYPVVMMQRLHNEESSGRAEALQGTTLTRFRWAVGHLVVMWLGTLALLAVAGLVYGVSFVLLVSGSWSDVPRILGGTLGMTPAAWLVGAICMLAYGFVPRWSVAIGWLVWAYVAISGRIVGPLYGQWAGLPFEPFHYLPNTVAGGAYSVLPAVVLVALTVLFAGGGLVALHRRNFG